MFELTKQQEMLRDMVREFAEAELAPKALDLDRKGEFPRDLVKKLGEQGLIGMAASKEVGAVKMSMTALPIFYCDTCVSSVADSIRI